MPIPRTILGNTKEEVSVIGLGCMTMSPTYGGSVDDEHSVETLNRALDLGVNFWDTADLYGRGHNEKLLSRVLKERRKEVFLCTKFGFCTDPKDPMARSICGTPEYVKEACKKSLERLDVDYIDLYYQHRVDANTPIEETVRAMAELVKEGKVRYIGLSECSAETLRRAHKVHPITAVQVEYSLWTTDIETNGLLEACRELGITVVAYSPLGRGFLTGSVKSVSELQEGDWRRHNPRFQGENFENNLKLAKVVEDLAKQKGCTPAQLCIAWVLAQGKDIIPIPGTRRLSRLEENLNSIHVKLTQDDLEKIRGLINSVGVHGDRYRPADMRFIDN
ncbi:uncharacterized protein VTP21DRAFT_4644 [Calcarisporiella thermophila]|uniref:uncharacterized protein n=1 Tax=Calcarisporiella thermophila TaxID=911321 RepID=UPI003742EAEB